MSTSTKLRKTYSGIFGNQVVLKNVKSNSVMTMKPLKPAKELSVKQLVARQRFQCAIDYARRMMQDPVLLAKYKAKAGPGKTAFRLAVKDFMNPPMVLEIDASGYHGNAGEVISVKALDDFELASVRVNITAADGTLVEEGDCLLNLPAVRYHYTATVQVTDITGATITAIARDLPDNATELTVAL